MSSSCCGGDKRAWNMACFSSVIRRDGGLPPSRTCAGALFGSIVLELPDAPPRSSTSADDGAPPATLTVDVFVTYGEVVLLVPRGARVLTDSLVLLSSVHDESGFGGPPAADEPPLTVHVTGFAAFSRVTVLAKQQQAGARGGAVR
jgi:hypothetical protein